MDDALMRMYEAQAELVERNKELAELRRQNAMLQRRLEEETQRRNEVALENIQDKLETFTVTINSNFVELSQRVDDLALKIQQNAEVAVERNNQYGDERRKKNNKAQAKEAQQMINQQERRLERKLQANQHVPQANKTILVVEYGSNSTGGNLRVLDYKNKQWRMLSLKVPRSRLEPALVNLNDEIYMIGGRSNDNRDYGETCFKLTKELQWVEIARLRNRITNIANSCVEFNGCIWIMGGNELSEYSGSKKTKIYNKNEDAWNEGPEMNIHRHNAVAVVMNNKIFVFGGNKHKPEDRCITSVEYYDPNSQTWTILELPLPPKVNDIAVVNYKEGLVGLGGVSNNGNEQSVLRSVWKIDIPNQRINSMPPMINSHCVRNCHKIGTEIWVINPETEFFNGTVWKKGPKYTFAHHYQTVLISEEMAQSMLLYYAHD